MSAPTIVRVEPVDDDGTGTTGTVFNKSWIDSVYAAIDILAAALFSVAGGGTGVSTLAAHGLVVGNGTSAVNVTGAGTAGQVLTSNGASADPTFQAAAGSNSVCDGRLTLTSGTPVTTSDVTGATSVYFTPYKGNQIALYNGSAWVTYTFTELTLALGTLTNDLPYDVFVYDNSGTRTLEALAWTSKTARATALVLQDGVLCKTGALTRRYLGSFHTTATTTTEDSRVKRLLYNYYNQKARPMVRQESTTSYAYSTKTWRQANANTANQLAVLIGWPGEEPVDVSASHMARMDTASAAAAVGIGLDVTNAVHADMTGASVVQVAGTPNLATVAARLVLNLAVGYHFLAWLEKSDANGGTVTYYTVPGTSFNSGMDGFAGINAMVRA